MVKNVTGGNKHKGQARKVVNGGKVSSNKLRLAKEEGEMYAQVNKIFGGPNMSVVCMDNVTRNCVIRGKFRNKRDSNVKPGSWVLVGLRDWTTEKKDTVQVCDLLEVYQETDKERLKKQECNLSWKNFAIDDGTNKATIGVEIDFEYSDTTAQEEYEVLMKEELGGGDGLTLSIAFDEDSIDINDI
jgi:initiation factor 1A